LLLDCIVRLQEVGIIVKVVVCDQGANNRGMFANLNISIDKPFVEINSRKVYFMYDPPHLLKSVRNNFKRYPVQLAGGGIARWDHVKKLFDLDSSHKLRLTPKLKLSHILLNGFKEMNVRLAAQVLSHSVGVGISFYINTLDHQLPQEAMVTAEFVLRMDRIFDSVNASNFKDLKLDRRPIASSSYHVAFWDESVKWLRAIKFVGSKARIYCVDGWQLTLTAMKLLWQDVESLPGVTFLAPRRVNQDCLGTSLGLFTRLQQYFYGYLHIFRVRH
jgi:hypothetical protein